MAANGSSASYGCGRPTGQVEQLVEWRHRSMSGRGRSREPWAGLPVGPAVRRCRRAGRGRAAEAGRQVRTAGHRRYEQHDRNDAVQWLWLRCGAASVPEVRAEDRARVMKVSANRHRGLSWRRTGSPAGCAPCRAGCDRAGSAGDQRSSGHRLLDALEPRRGGGSARHAVAVELVADLRRIDVQLRDTRRRITAAVEASQTTITERSGSVRSSPRSLSATSATSDASRAGDHFAAYNGTAPIEVSSGRNTRSPGCRGRGTVASNHAIHIAAVTQIRHRHSPGRAYYDRKITEGMTGKEATRALKRRISDAVYRHLRHDAEQATGRTQAGPGTGERQLEPARPARHPEHRLFRSSHAGTRHHRATDEPRHAGRGRRRPGLPEIFLTNEGRSGMKTRFGPRRATASRAAST